MQTPKQTPVMDLSDLDVLFKSDTQTPLRNSKKRKSESVKVSPPAKRARQLKAAGETNISTNNARTTSTRKTRTTRKIISKQPATRKCTQPLVAITSPAGTRKGAARCPANQVEDAAPVSKAPMKRTRGTTVSNSETSPVSARKGATRSKNPPTLIEETIPMKRTRGKTVSTSASMTYQVTTRRHATRAKCAAIEEPIVVPRGKTSSTVTEHAATRSRQKQGKDSAEEENIVEIPRKSTRGKRKIVLEVPPVKGSVEKRTVRSKELLPEDKSSPRRKRATRAKGKPTPAKPKPPVTKLKPVSSTEESSGREVPRKRVTRGESKVISIPAKETQSPAVAAKKKRTTRAAKSSKTSPLVKTRTSKN